MHFCVSICLLSKVYSVKMGIVKLFALVALMSSMDCLDWDLSLKIGSDDNYQRPPNKAMNDYASFQEISDLAREIFENLERLKVLKSQIEDNEKHDKILQCLLSAGVIIGGAMGLLFKIKKVQRLANRTKVQVVPGGSGKNVIQMTNPVESQSYFGNAAF